jgi:hypothetical protein
MNLASSKFYLVWEILSLPSITMSHISRFFENKVKLGLAMHKKNEIAFMK